MPDDNVVREFVRASRRNDRKPCKIHAALERLKPADRTKAMVGLQLVHEEHPDVTVGGVVTWFKDQHKLEVSSSAVTSHCKHKCACFPDE